jgi:hypothetical protein
MISNHLIEKLRLLMRFDKPREYYAEKLGVTPLEVLEAMQQIWLEDSDIESAAAVIKDAEFDKIGNVRHLTFEEFANTKTAKATGSSPTEIKELHEFLQEANIDLTKWEVLKFTQSHYKGNWRFSASFKQREISSLSREEIASVIKKTLSDTLTPLTVPKTQPYSEKALVIYVADEHVGAAVSTSALYRNTYNREVYRDRKMRILNTVLEEVKTYGIFSKIAIVSLGDTMDGYNGQTTRGGHHLPQNMDDREALDTYLQVNKEFWDSLCQLRVAEQLEFHCQTNDNHSGAWGYAANVALREYVNIKYPSVETHIYSRFMDHFKLGTHTLILCHGKDEKNRKSNLPLHLNAQATVLIKDYMDNYGITPDAGKVHFCKGDLHQDACETGKGFRYRNVLSLFGASSWVMDNFGRTRAGFSYDIYDLQRAHVTESRTLL